MKDWIKKNVNPLGMEKKNRGSLYAFTARVFDRLKEDALKAFNAHFPYLSDPEKLREHGRALSVPELPDDTEAEYRDRVAAASFYLMKAGERGYITSQLAAHFGEDRYIAKEEFLKIYLQVLDLTDGGLVWARDFLDSTVDPNISLNFGRWKKFVDRSRIKENWNIEIGNKTIDAVLLEAALGIRLNLMFREEIGKAVRYDGRYEYDGSIAYNQNLGFYDAVRVSSVPHNIDRIYHGDAASIGLKLLFKDNPNKEIRYDGKYRYDGAVDYYSGESTVDRFSAQVNSKIHDAVKLSERMKSGVTLRPAADAVKAADRVTGGVTLRPMADAVKAADRVINSVTLRPADTAKAADRVTGGVTLRPMADAVKAADRIIGGVTLRPMADAAKTADRVTGGVTLRPEADAVKASDRAVNSVLLHPADKAGIKSKAAVKVRKSTLYDGEISYDGGYSYEGYTEEEVH